MSHAADRSFYDMWQDEDKPAEDQDLALEAAKLKARKYNLDNRIYIVKGFDIFVVHSKDVKMERNAAEGTRNISIGNARMIKYTEDGKRVEDK